jgi:hypothetical protein
MMLLGCALSFVITYYFVAQHPKHPNKWQERIKDMMLAQAVAESCVLLLVLLFFKSMYFNKWGQRSPEKDELSDMSSSAAQTLRHNSIGFTIESPASLRVRPSPENSLQIQGNLV